MAESGERDVRNCDVSAESGSHQSRIPAYDAGTEDKHACRLHAGHTAEEDAASAVRLLKEARGLLHRHASGDLAHRDEQRKAALRTGNSLIGYADM